MHPLGCGLNQGQGQGQPASWRTAITSYDSAYARDVAENCAPNWGINVAHVATLTKKIYDKTSINSAYIKKYCR